VFKMRKLADVPEEITLVYREIGHTHAFTALDFPGFHVGSGCLKTVYRIAMRALSEHVSSIYRCDAHYEYEIPYEQFADHIHGRDVLANFVIAKSVLGDTERVRKTPRLL
jgi:hypothetical protein